MESPNQIKSLRIKVGLSQSKVAMYLGISQSEYGRIELGRRKIGKYLEKLAEILAVNSEQLAAFDARSNDQKIERITQISTIWGSNCSRQCDLFSV